MTQTLLCFPGHTIKVYLIHGTSDNKIVDKSLFLFDTTIRHCGPLLPLVILKFKDAGTFKKKLAVEFIEMLFQHNDQLYIFSLLDICLYLY